jgi:hypothetical protein
MKLSSLKLYSLISKILLAMFLVGGASGFAASDSELTDVEMAQRFSGRYKVVSNELVKNHCANISTSDLYRFDFVVPYYSDQYRESKNMGVDQRGLTLSFDRKLEHATLTDIKEDLNWVSAFDRPSFKGLNDGDSVDHLPGLNVDDSSRIYETISAVTGDNQYGPGSKIGPDIVALQQSHLKTNSGVEIRLQLLTLTQFRETYARRVEGKAPELTVVKATYVKYQYFVVVYGVTGLIEKIDSVDECVFKRL